MTGSKVLSVLVVHPEAETRRALVETLRLALPGAALHTSEASTPTQALQAASWLDPKVVLLDLIAERRLALDVARTLRRPGRWILGLYNPLIAADRGAELFRAGARAGVTDYIALPASEAELAAALSALESSASESRRDGRAAGRAGSRCGKKRRETAIGSS